MPPLSAGILMYRRGETGLEVLLGHPGGPFWRGKNRGAWSIPKGLVSPGEMPLDAAKREFYEETGTAIDDAVGDELGSVVQRSGKVVAAWAVRGDLDPDQATSNTVTLEWPRGSGRMITFPEVDEVRWCSMETARELINVAQVALLDRLQKSLDHRK